MLNHNNKLLLVNDDDETVFEKIGYCIWKSWFYQDLYRYSWLYKLRWKVTHWWRKDHWVKTNLRCDYHDKLALMEDALFSLVDNYVSRNEEDAFSNVSFDWHDEYLDAKAKIIKILHFYNVKLPAMEKRESEILHEYMKDYDMVFGPVDKSTGLGELGFSYSGELSERQREDLKKAHENLESQIFKETQEMLGLCVEVRPYLWT